ncbi:uncharacterized protein LOC119552556 [Drosophila subpulchrella]|uniref:uncharacterized protein LOC119552556 n=1 Tax=Drosophila subpulchrella TaxID=1486046 RepID=UPI0018A1A65B|nr:uncharacterized protein LOC119552556 [Drosophila subpulchrella]
MLPACAIVAMTSVVFITTAVVAIYNAGFKAYDCPILRDTITVALLADNRNQFDLPLDIHLDPHESRLMICNGTEFSTSCQEDGVFYPPLPSPNCVETLKPFIELVQDPSCPHTIYVVGLSDGTRQMELFHSSFFLKKYLISATDEASFQQSNIYNRFEALLGPQQRYIASPQSPSFDRGHLTPAADFPNAWASQQTNRYLNGVPQYYRINRGNWRNVENWIRQQHDTQIVCTGALGVLELNNRNQVPTPIYLAEGRNPVPRWIYKIIYSVDSKKTTVILTSNNGWETVGPNPYAFCRVVPCPPTLILTEVGFTFCCDPTDFIKRNNPWFRVAFRHTKDIFGDELR